MTIRSATQLAVILCAILLATVAAHADATFEQWLAAQWPAAQQMSPQEVVPWAQDDCATQALPSRTCPAGARASANTSGPDFSSGESPSELRTRKRSAPNEENPFSSAGPKRRSGRLT